MNTPAVSGCLVSSPVAAYEAENDQVLALACDLGWPNPIPCSKPATPTLVANSEEAQGVVLQAVVPTFLGGDGNAYSVWWEAWQGSTFLWQHESTDGIPTGGLPASTVVEFGAPGLVANSGNRIRVAFTDSTGRKTCWSYYLDPINTPDFTQDSPGAPSNTAIMVEDEFRRPATTYKAANGDGLGPKEVWDGEFQTVIDADEEMALLAPVQAVGSGATYGALTNPHAYAEGYFVNDVTTNTNYNIDISARSFVDPSDNKGKLFFVKLENDVEGQGEPWLKIGRIVDQTIDYLTKVKLENITDCPSSTPLIVENGTTGRSNPVWLRIEVNDNKGFGYAIVTGTVAWDCTSGGIDSCGTSCSITFSDVGDPEEMYGEQGVVGFDSHHSIHYLDRFRAGWESIP